MAWWLWFLTGVALLAVEMFTPGGFFFLFFGVGALIVGGMALLGVTMPMWGEWLTFSAISIASLALFRGRLLQRFPPVASVMDTDTMVGAEAVAMEVIAPGQVGRVDARGTAWKARNMGTATLSTGDRCVVQTMDGVVLGVRPVEALKPVAVIEGGQS